MQSLAVSALARYSGRSMRVAWPPVQRMCASQQAVDLPEPRRSSLASAFAQGTGGRCSYSGDTCTVFGATGMLGTAFVNRIAKNGTQLIIPYRRDAYDCRHLRTAGELGQFYFMPYFLKDDDAIRRAVKYSNLVVNFVGANYETPLFSFEDLHVNAARRIARICREMGVQRLVHFSAMNASTEPGEFFIPGGSTILKTKALGEQAVREEFPDATIIRPAEVYCYVDKFVNVYMGLIRRQIGVSVGLYRAGKGIFKAPVFLSDVVSATLKALTDPASLGQTYELVGPYSYEFGDLLNWMYELCSRGQSRGFKLESYGVTFQLKTLFNEIYPRIFRAKPLWNWEHVERFETRSDVLTGCRTFADLGITPGPFEDKARDVLEVHDFAALWRVTKEELVHPPLPVRYPHLQLQRRSSVIPEAPFLSVEQPPAGCAPIEVIPSV